jgi:hypothetical protein
MLVTSVIARSPIFDWPFLTAVLMSWAARLTVSEQVPPSVAIDMVVKFATMPAALTSTGT